MRLFGGCGCNDGCGGNDNLLWFIILFILLFCNGGSIFGNNGCGCGCND